MGMQLIETIEVGVDEPNSIQFIGIPQDGIDLLCVFSARTTAPTSADCYVQINSQYSSSHKRLLGDGSSASTSTASPVFRIPATSYTSNTFGSASIYISNYTVDAIQKSVSIDAVTENNAALSEWNTIVALLSTNTAPVTQFGLGFSAKMAQYSTASLYKITAD